MIIMRAPVTWILCSNRSKLRLKRAPDTRILRANPEQVQCIGASEQYRLFVGMSVYTFEPSESTSVSEAALKMFPFLTSFLTRL